MNFIVLILLVCFKETKFACNNENTLGDWLVKAKDVRQTDDEIEKNKRFIRRNFNDTKDIEEKIIELD